jgi:acyl carrier protein
MDKKDRVYEVVQQMCQHNPNLEDSMKLDEDLGFDSLDKLELGWAIEEEFDLDDEISEEALSEIKTLGDLVKYVESHNQDG